jgi:hypothetical protein
VKRAIAAERGGKRPSHMLSGPIAYQILRTEIPSTSVDVRSTLEKQPWYESRWKDQLANLHAPERDEMLFMVATRWADDIRTRDKAQHRGPWHYIDWPFKPDGQPASVQSKPPGAVNILTALAENERIAKTDNDPTRRAIALSWLFHLVGDIHQPLHLAQIFLQDGNPSMFRDRVGSIQQTCQQKTPNAQCRRPRNDPGLSFFKLF